MQVRISFRSHSDLVLDADHALDLLSVSLCRRVSRFVAFQTRVAHLCFCLVRIKMPLLRCLFIFLPCMWGLGVPGIFLNQGHYQDKCSKRQNIGQVRHLGPPDE